MISFMLWAAIVGGFALGFIFGDADTRGTLMFWAMAIAVAAGFRLLDKAKKNDRS